MSNTGWTMEKSLRAVAFVARCSGAATVAYELAFSLGLPEAHWAAMSALIVSQERLQETRSSLMGRVVGTLLGIVVTIAVSEVASRAAASTAMQMAVAVATSALIVRKFPQLRVAMWTCPVILLTAQPSMPIVMAALPRGGEVILGASIGWIFHWAAEVVVDKLTALRSLYRSGRQCNGAQPGGTATQPGGMAPQAEGRSP